MSQKPPGFLACLLPVTMFAGGNALATVAGADPATAGAVGASLAAVGKFFEALGPGLIQDFFQKRAEARKQAHDFAINSTLARAFAEAVANQMRGVADEAAAAGDKAPAKLLRQVAASFDDHWLAQLHKGYPEGLKNADGQALANAFSEAVANDGALRLERHVWEFVLKGAGLGDTWGAWHRDLGERWPKLLLDRLTGRELPQGFLHVLTFDEKASHKMTLRLLASFSEQARSPEVRADLSDKDAAKLDQALSGLDQQLSAIQSRLDALEGKVDAVHGEVKGARADIRQLASEEIQKRAEELRREEKQRQAGYDISRILKYAPAELIGREAELRLLNDAWHGGAELPLSPDIGAAQQRRPTRPKILTFVALGGEGKTSLVAKWAAALANENWPGCDAAFAWSFYSQGTREQLAASSDLFLKEALDFFATGTKEEVEEIKAFAASPAGAFEKGQRLARIVGQRRSLLILDGLEPLQYAPTSPTPGQLKDQGIAALLKGLAAASHGLCVVTTRYSLPDLKAFWQTTAPEVKLLRLSRDAGVHLLKTLGVRGTAKEFETLVEDAKGHALTLNLVGSYLFEAHAGDIRKRSLLKLEEADAEEGSRGHAWHVMAAYERWLESDDKRGRRAVVLLLLIGLFDGPATSGCLGVLLKDSVIPNLTEPLFGQNEAQLNTVISRLETANLLTANRDASGALLSLDTHPHIREYFSKQLRTEQPDAWRAAHRRLYEHLCASTPDKPQPTLEDLQPLYQAVAHGCQAGLQQEACANVYRQRINHGSEYYAADKLGARGSELGAVACFFDQPWSRVSPQLIEVARAWLLNEAAFCLRALGRLTEALEPMRAGLVMRVQTESWDNAARSAGNLSELELTLGEVAQALGDAEQSVTYADRSGDAFEQMSDRTTLADALHQAGRRAEAETRFREAEQMQAERQPAYPLLYSLGGFRYCDLLLAAPERAAWQRTLECGDLSPLSAGDLSPSGKQARPRLDEPLKRGSASPTSRQSGQSGDESPHSKALRAVSQRAAQTLDWSVNVFNFGLLTITLDHLTLGRASLYAAILSGGAALPRRLAGPQPGPTGEDDWATARRELDAAVAGLRRAGQAQELPLGLLTRAWLRFLTGARTGPGSAQEDLDEAWEIAERGPMRLHMADIHLYRARLFGSAKSEAGSGRYPWDRNPDGSPRSAKDDLAAAEKLINACGYHRRDEELDDAKRAIPGIP